VNNSNKLHHTPAMVANEEPKQAALRYILDAWHEAVQDGIESDCLAMAAMFAALSDMVETYGEEPVAKMAEGLADRIRIGEFTIGRSIQ
jgi:predicted YcjX-like family ATPase